MEAVHVHHNQNEEAVGVEGAAETLGVSRPEVYRLMKKGGLRSFHIGRRRLLLRSELSRFLRERAESSGA